MIKNIPNNVRFQCVNYFLSLYLDKESNSEGGLIDLNSGLF